jgi:hypothetical protein
MGAGIVWQNGYRLANKVTLVCGTAHFSQWASTLKSGDTGLTLIFGNAWLKGKKENLIQCESFGSVKATDRMCVCSGGTSRDSTTKREAVFWNFDSKYLPCFLHSPRYSLWWGGWLEGRVEYTIKWRPYQPGDLLIYFLSFDPCSCFRSSVYTGV